MKRQTFQRGFLSLIFFSTLAGMISLAGMLSLGGCAGREKPNIVFIYIDDLGWKDVGFMGSRYYETPHIDRLASQGMVFTDAYACAPNCAPSRACLFTGQYSPRHGMYTVNSSVRGHSEQRKLIPIPNKLDLETRFVTFAEVLKEAGYATGSIGKWHLGDDPQYGPTAQGFDVNIAGDRWGMPKTYFSPYQMSALEDGPEDEYLTDRLTDEALKFLEENRTRPFFLYLSHYAVHSPTEAKTDITRKYLRKKPDGDQGNPVYAAMVESMDESVGRVVKKLDELNLTEKTVVVFFSDNGGHGPVTGMEPLRGSKGMVYEGGIRVPMIVRWPGSVKPGSRSSVPVIGVDFFPTILEIAGVEKSPDQVLDGESIVKLLQGETVLERKALFWHFPVYIEGRRKGNRDPNFRARPSSVIRQGDWKLIEYFEDGDLELFHLSEDIGETRNLADENPAKREELHSVLVAWRKTVQAPVPTEPNPDYDPNFKPKPRR